MSLIKPFRGLRPLAGRADDVVAPPYDVVDRTEAKALADGRPWSFLHISRPEIDLPDDVDPYAPEVYAKGRENLDRMIAEGVLVRDATPCYYAYRLTMGEHVQTGLVARPRSRPTTRAASRSTSSPARSKKTIGYARSSARMPRPVRYSWSTPPTRWSTISFGGHRTAADVDVTAERDGVRHEIWKIDRKSCRRADRCLRSDAVDLRGGRSSPIGGGFARR